MSVDYINKRTYYYRRFHVSRKEEKCQLFLCAVALKNICLKRMFQLLIYLQAQLQSALMRRRDASIAALQINISHSTDWLTQSHREYISANAVLKFLFPQFIHAWKLAILRPPSGLITCLVK